ncbi:MAG TPA: GAF and ANTAR domain-containing protein [Cellulomonas sp.]|uniref:GAF and ANTAR domain-containing protein n=1 Tax=Cellulomonas sp. TaxID=40001 RepID=UPI002E36FF49|nr:GAF and ANTAR domain-containing protein [Cellulomonas sp.]HEX5331346.1 GAF and ANTAR domain-containing protein [Cellulomonas sp.]
MDESVEAMTQLARAVDRGATQEPLAQRLCRACLEILGAGGAAITLATTRPESLTIWATDRTSAALESLQDVIGEGPSREAFDSGSPVVVQLDAAVPGPYAVFDDMAEDLLGKVTIWALPMRPAGTTIGVLTLYRSSGGLRRTLDEAQRIADAVGAALLEDARTEVPTSLAAWSERAVVHQAIGMVVAQLGVPTVDALALLRAHAYTSATTLTAVASAVVSRHLDLAGTPDDSGRPARGPTGSRSAGDDDDAGSGQP